MVLRGRLSFPDHRVSHFFPTLAPFESFARQLVLGCFPGYSIVKNALSVMILLRLQPRHDVGDVLRAQAELFGAQHERTGQSLLRFDAIRGNELRDRAH